MTLRRDVFEGAIFEDGLLKFWLRFQSQDKLAMEIYSLYVLCTAPPLKKNEELYNK